MPDVHSLFPAGVEVRPSDLQLESTERRRGDRVRLADLTLGGGVAQGLIVSSADGATLDVTAGRGYTVAGYEVSLAADVLAVAPLGGTSVLALRYEETVTDPAPDLGGTPQPRRATSTSALVAFTQAEFDALSQAELDVLCVLASVVVTDGLITSLTRAGLRETIVMSPLNYPGVAVLAARPSIAGTTLDSTTVYLNWFGWRNDNLAGGLANPAYLRLEDAADGTASGSASVTPSVAGSTTITVYSPSGIALDLRIWPKLLPRQGFQAALSFVRTSISRLSLGTPDLNHRLQGDRFPTLANPHGMTHVGEPSEVSMLVTGLGTNGPLVGSLGRVVHGLRSASTYTLLEVAQPDARYPAYRRYYRSKGEVGNPAGIYSVALVSTYNAWVDDSEDEVDPVWRADNSLFPASAWVTVLDVGTGTLAGNSDEHFTVAANAPGLQGSFTRAAGVATGREGVWEDLWFVAAGWEARAASTTSAPGSSTPGATPGAAPTSIARPVIVGGPVLGETLSMGGALTDYFVSDGAMTATYAWYTSIAGNALGLGSGDFQIGTPTWRPNDPALEGLAVYLEVTATNAAGSTTARSLPVRLQPAPELPPGFNPWNTNER